jgi:hypothetical protein
MCGGSDFLMKGRYDTFGPKDGFPCVQGLVQGGKADARAQAKKNARFFFMFSPSANIRKSPETRRAVRKSFVAQNLKDLYGSTTVIILVRNGSKN